MAEPLHTWLKGVFRNLSTQNAIWVYLKKRVKVNGPKSHYIKEINLRNWKSWRKKIQCNRFCFISVWAQTVLRFSSTILVSIKNRCIKNSLDINLWRKKEHLAKYFVVCETFRLQCLLDDLVNFLELSVFINASLP